MKLINLQLKEALWFSVNYSSHKCDLEKIDLEKSMLHREYWIIYRGPGSKLSHFLSLTVCRRSTLLFWGGGEPGPLEIVQYFRILHSSFTFSSSFSCLFISHPHCCCSSPPQRAGPWKVHLAPLWNYNSLNHGKTSSFVRAASFLLF